MRLATLNNSDTDGFALYCDSIGRTDKRTDGSRYSAAQEHNKSGEQCGTVGNIITSSPLLSSFSSIFVIFDILRNLNFNGKDKYAEINAGARRASKAFGVSIIINKLVQYRMYVLFYM